VCEFEQLILTDTSTVRDFVNHWRTVLNDDNRTEILRRLVLYLVAESHFLVTNAGIPTRNEILSRRTW